MPAVTHAVLGTAGHIDHGKTTLIKALTGQDTDRLKEEKERGISIDLGFAYLTLPDGTRVGIVDVPGHERFIRNMLAGAHGIDLVLFTVAADDGVMPQTEEHFDVLHLLGVKRGLFVMTKADLVAPARLVEVAEEIELLTEGSALAGSPVLAVSAVSGLGMAELKAQIALQLSGFAARRKTGIFRMPIDRAFTIKGHGTVVTGTALGAEVAVGQSLRVLPGEAEVRVRGVQVHAEPVASAGLCQRVALNLSGAERLDLQRGQTLADPRLNFVTTRCDTQLELRPAAKRAMETNARIRLYIGTTEALGRVIVLEPGGRLEPKSVGLAQLVLLRPVVALRGDRFVIRDETSQRTLGGGVVLNPLGRRYRKPLDDYRRRLLELLAPEAATGLAAMLELQESFALSAAHLALLLGLPLDEVETLLKDSRFAHLTLGEEEVYTTAQRWQALGLAVRALVIEHHQREPLAPGLEMELLRGRLHYAIAPRAFRALLDSLAAQTDLVRDDNTVRLRAHRVELVGEDRELAEQIVGALAKAGLQPLDPAQLLERSERQPRAQAQLKSVLAALLKQGRIVRLASELYLDRAHWETVQARLVDYLGRHGEITAAAFRDLMGLSRKYAIVLLEGFDQAGITTRVGDARRLRKSAPESAPR